MAIVSDALSQVSQSLAKNTGATLKPIAPTISKSVEKKMVVDSNFDDRIRTYQLRRNDDIDIAANTLYRLVKSKWDYIINRFTAILFWYNGQSLDESYLHSIGDSRESGKVDYSNLSKKAQSILTKEGFYVRFGQIEIPQVVNSTFELAIGETSIQKIRSSKEMVKKANFTFRLDENLEWLDFFEKGAGINDTITGKADSEKKIYEYNFMQGMDDIKNQVSFIARSFSLGNRGSVKDQRLCLAVCADDFNTDIMIDREARHPEWYYLFEDIRLVGIDSGIEYNADSSGSTDATISFVYKRVRKFDLSKSINTR